MIKNLKYIVKSGVSNITQKSNVKNFYRLKCHTKIVSRLTITMAKVNYKVSHNIYHSLMSAVVGDKSLVILTSIGVHIGLTLGPLCCRFIGGL